MAKRDDPVNSGNFLLTLGEELRRQAVRPNINGYVPHAKQIDFHTSPARTRLYIGGNRSGKSFGNVAECVYWLRKEHPFREIPVSPYEATRGRINTVDFINGTDKILLPLFKQLLPPSSLRNGSWEDSYHRASHVLTLANDSFLEFLSYESDLDKFAGTSRHFIAYDEEPPEVIYTENLARLVDTGGHQWFSMTPVEGMSWVYDKIYMPGKGGNPDYHITEISMDENPYLNEAEIKRFLDNIDDDNEREARGSGKFIEMGGLIYKKFDPTPGGPYVIDRENLRFPKSVPVGVSLDHGYNNPTAVLWHALLPEGKIVTFHEHYLSGETVAGHARAIHDFNRSNKIEPTIWIADPSIRNTDPITGTSIQQEYLKYGIPFQLANNDVRAGIERVNSYLKGRAGGEPMWKVTKDCKFLIKEMPRYKWKTYTSKKLNSQYNNWEEPHKLNDHACDSLRYFLMSRPNLDDMFAHANDRQDMDVVYDGAVRTVSGDFTPTMLRSDEVREWERQAAEYVSGSEEDMLGGMW